jgi:hypothetical protein
MEDEMMDKVISYTAAAGQAIEIRVIEGLRHEATCEVKIDGKYDWTGRPVMTKAPVGKAVAQIGRKLGLTHERLDEVNAALCTLQAEINLRPDVRLARRIEARRVIVDRIEANASRAHELHTAAIERVSATGVMCYGDSITRYEADAESARADLAEFDAAHPDVVQAIQLDRADQVARAIRCD